MGNIRRHKEEYFWSCYKIIADYKHMSIMSRYALCCYRKIHDPITEEFQARPPPCRVSIELLQIQWRKLHGGIIQMNFSSALVSQHFSVWLYTK